MASIRLEHVAKTYDNGQKAVEDFHLEVDDGEFLVLVGPSGCGKSTTLRMIAGLESISDGIVYIDGQPVNDQPPSRRNIAMVFQNYALYPHMTVRQNMAFGLKMRKTSRADIKQRVDQAADILSISTLLDRRPKQLSGGQRQRVALGRAIVRQPAAFLFDEPLSNLDAKLRIQMRKELAQLHQRLKTTTIYVTHDQIEAMTLGDRIVIMNEGRVQQVDCPLQLYEQPANRFVASFVGSPAMNLISGQLRADADKAIWFIPDGQAVQEERESEYQIPPSAKPGLGPIVMGFRPEQLSLDRQYPLLASVNVDVVERLGDESLIYFRWCGQAGIARLKGNVDVQPNSRLPIHLPATAWYFFSTDESGALLASGNHSSFQPSADQAQ